MGSIFIGLIILTLFVVLIIFLIEDESKECDEQEQKEIKRAGDKGEAFFNERIKEILNENDVHLNNIVIESNDKTIEIDNLILNENGIFIIEVKYYIGKLYGNIEDKYWTKDKTAINGETYSKDVKNPLKQAKTQTYYLKEFLKENGIDIWIEPYAFLINGGIPVQDERIIENIYEFDEILHTKQIRTYNKELIDKAVKIIPR